MEKQQRKQKSKQKKTEMKGIRMSMRTDEHDLEFKKKQTDKFLDKGHKVKIEIILKGREKAYMDDAKEKLIDFVKSLKHPTTIEEGPKKQGRGMTIIISTKQ